MMEGFPNFRIPSTVETPAVCIDRVLMERNIQRMASGLKAKGVAFRPHVKSHKYSGHSSQAVGGWSGGTNDRDNR